MFGEREALRIRLLQIDERERTLLKELDKERNSIYDRLRDLDIKETYDIEIHNAKQSTTYLNTGSNSNFYNPTSYDTQWRPVSNISETLQPEPKPQTLTRQENIDSEPELSTIEEIEDAIEKVVMDPKKKTQVLDCINANEVGKAIELLNGGDTEEFQDEFEEVFEEVFEEEKKEKKKEPQEPIPFVGFAEAAAEVEKILKDSPTPLKGGEIENRLKKKGIIRKNFTNFMKDISSKNEHVVKIGRALYEYHPSEHSMGDEQQSYMN